MNLNEAKKGLETRERQGVWWLVSSQLNDLYNLVISPHIWIGRVLQNVGFVYLELKSVFE